MVAMATTRPLQCVLVCVCVAVCLFTSKLDLCEDRKVITILCNVLTVTDSEPQLIQGT